MNEADPRDPQSVLAWVWAVLPFLLCIAITAYVWFVVVPDAREQNAEHRTWAEECRAAAGDVVYIRGRGYICVELIRP